MNNEMIVKIRKCLDNLKQKPVKISQNGFIINQFFMSQLMYKIQDDILNLRDEAKEVYLSLNLKYHLVLYILVFQQKIDV